MTLLVESTSDHLLLHGSGGEDKIRFMRRFGLLSDYKPTLTPTLGIALSHANREQGFLTFWNVYKGDVYDPPIAPNRSTRPCKVLAAPMRGAILEAVGKDMLNELERTNLLRLTQEATTYLPAERFIAVARFSEQDISELKLCDPTYYNNPRQRLDELVARSLSVLDRTLEVYDARFTTEKLALNMIQESIEEDD
jgi:hypothetical protein